jgi:DNA-binding transcriptional LysR family regulator
MLDFRFLRHLWYFLAVAEEGSFGRAASRLGISQPPLSQQISILERVLGVTLFERSRSGTILTKEGAAILPAVRKLAAQAQRVEAIVRQAKAGSADSITIGAITSAIFELLPRVLARLKELHPGVTISLVELDTADALKALEVGEIDVAFVRSHHSSGRIRVEPLAKDQLVAVLPAGHLLAAGETVDLALLAEEPMAIFPRKVSPASYDSIMGACYAKGFSPLALHEVSSVHSQVGFVACGIGVALVPRGVVRTDMTSVVYRPLKDPVDIATIAVAWNAALEFRIISQVVDAARHACQEGGGV